MSRRLFDFECEDGHRHEALTDSEAREHQCPTCGKLAQRLIGTPRPVLDGMSGHFPTASEQWVKRRESHMRKEHRNKERHGTHK